MTGPALNLAERIKAAKPNYHAQPIPIDDIFVVGQRRAVDTETVHALVKSINSIGLQTPITIRIQADVPDPETGEVFDQAYVVVAGRHRLEACRMLSWKDIPAIVRDCDEVEAELIEIAENLHRRDLTKEQRDQHIRRYAELLKMREEGKKGQADLSTQNAPINSAAPKPRGRPKGTTGIANRIAASTGLSKSTVNRALNPKPTPAKPKEKPIQHPDLVATVRALNVAWSPTAIETATSVLTTEERANLQQHLPDVIGKLQRLAEPGARPVEALPRSSISYVLDLIDAPDDEGSWTITGTSPEATVEITAAGAGYVHVTATTGASTEVVSLNRPIRAAYINQVLTVAGADVRSLRWRCLSLDAEPSIGLRQMYLEAAP